jgi:hypothetical protein
MVPDTRSYPKNKTNKQTEKLKRKKGWRHSSSGRP